LNIIHPAGNDLAAVAEIGAVLRQFWQRRDSAARSADLRNGEPAATTQAARGRP
jgi:hypothetical protein